TYATQMARRNIQHQQQLSKQLYDLNPSYNIGDLVWFKVLVGRSKLDERFPCSSKYYKIEVNNKLDSLVASHDAQVAQTKKDPTSFNPNSWSHITIVGIILFAIGTCVYVDPAVSVLIVAISTFADTVKSSVTDNELLDRELPKLKMSTDAIEAWKCHQLRAANQDLSRQELLQDLPANSVYILTDWAMKWLPEKYMEPQEDFFAKRGLSWHISVVVKKVTSTTTKSTAKEYYG
ncbi:unnamed protein product, partial [Didymodactylos carnosus]